MTDENKRLNIAEEWQRAAQAAAAARLLAEHGMVAEAVSRAYFRVFYTVRALLISVDREPRSHEGAQRFFNLAFVKPGLFPSADGRLVARLMKDRHDADYDASSVWTSEDFASLWPQVEDFCRRAEEHLRQGGWLPAIDR